MWLHYFEPHAPYRLTSYAKTHLKDYDGPFRDGAPTLRFFQLGQKIPWSDAERRAIRVLYDGEVREVDRLVGEILGALDSTGLEDHTVVVLTADHGQLLGEEGRVGHALSLAEVVLQVPLLVRDPRAAGPARVQTRVGLIDLLPTLLELAGIPDRPAIDARLVGRSLAPALVGGELDERIYFAEMQNQIREGWAFDETAVAGYMGDLKLVVGRMARASMNSNRIRRGRRPSSEALGGATCDYSNSRHHNTATRPGRRPSIVSAPTWNASFEHSATFADSFPICVVV